VENFTLWELPIQTGLDLIFNNRKQVIHIGEVSSSPSIVNCGVPQGSI
jgi:hypothetical protein